ncbi:MAG: molybdenum cofactor biosynthesis protein A [Saprospiraceae bacterium]|jgi:molybdenum cofactor biosynthesis protein A
MLYDNHGRVINYLRLAVTDRCNLRCFYCMPEEGINYMPKKELLTYEEMERVIRLMAGLGVNKVRITGGEPFLRKGMMDFIKTLNNIDGIEKLNVTTNGTLTKDLVPDFKNAGISSVNLSLDSLDEKRFFDITRRDNFGTVMDTFYQLLDHKITTKINAVVMNGRNIEDIIPMVELARTHPVSVRFIEEMPFNGTGKDAAQIPWDFPKILAHIKAHYPDLEKIEDPKHSTAFNYQIPGFKGTFGIIAAYSRLFCGSCNRIRLTPQGMLKTCLYDDGVFNLKNLIRAGGSDEHLKAAFLDALGHRAKDGFEAEQNRKFDFPVSESMATIGG